MNRTVLVSLALLAAVGSSSGEADDGVILRGLTVYGMDREEQFPVLGDDSLHRYVTIQFDIAARHPPQLKIRFLHCDRDWVPDESPFIQDDRYNTSFILAFRPSPGGVEQYAYRFINRFPDSGGVVQFPHSGNWMFRIMDGAESVIYGDGRFFVVENLVQPSMQVKNGYQTELPSPLNQIHRVDIRVPLSDEAEGMYYTAVDVYQNRRLHAPWRIDAWDRKPYTAVEGFGSGARQFSVLNIPSGNEYRTLDIGSANRYPNRDTVRVVEGVDLPRTFWRTGTDRDGIPRLNRFTGIASDYLPVVFRLDATAAGPVRDGGRRIYLVGPFNGWYPGGGDTLSPDGRERADVIIRLLRRGVYDYQYVTGWWDDSRQVVADQDWLALEGNDWRTTNTYTAFVYYHDTRFGGFDRIAGYASARSSGEAGVSH